MNNIKLAVSFISAGLLLGFTLVVYAHSNFATKETVNLIRDYQEKEETTIKADIKTIKEDIKKILGKI